MTMLARTANDLYWLARYVERAENVARILLAGHRMATMMRSLGSDSGEWRSTLVATGCEAGFTARHGEQATAEQVIDYMTRDPDNPSSILSCIETARGSARTVRTACTKGRRSTWRGAIPLLTNVGQVERARVGCAI